jgi:arylformamidase
LSLPVSPEIVRYPGDEPPSVQVSMARATDSGGGAIPSWEVTRWSLSSHAGTHVDAPSHLFPGGQTIDQVDLRRLAGPAVVVDCKRATAASRPVAASDLPEATTLRGKIVLLKLGVAGDLVSGSPGPGFAGLTAEAARLLAQAGVMAVGVDALSVDPVGGGHKAHGVLLGAGIPIIEALDLRAVMPGLAGLFAALPLKLAGAEAAPCRAVLVSHKVTTQGESQ